jgi:Kef-type K+ transport system membrane component KefB
MPWPERVLGRGGALLLPVFFVATGLRTDVGRLADPIAAVACLAIVAVATLGKLGGVYGAARMTGVGPRDALVLGTLMNTRGLMELVVLDVGFRLGLLGPDVYTMMVLMALVTTALAGPIVSRLKDAPPPA